MRNTNKSGTRAYVLFDPNPSTVNFTQPLDEIRDIVQAISTAGNSYRGRAYHHIISLNNRACTQNLSTYKGKKLKPSFF